MLADVVGLHPALALGGISQPVRWFDNDTGLQTDDAFNGGADTVSVASCSILEI